MDSNNYVQGTCLSMCSQEEIIMRDKERLVHVLEGYSDYNNLGQVNKGRNCQIKADPKKMVKSFQRSAAGRDMQCPEDLRPPYVLKKTVDYLMKSIVKVTHVKWPVVYGFVTDRLRAVRQDMVIQQPSVLKCAEILEPIVRFHAYSAYRLCEESINDFDPKLNASHFNECLLRLLKMYELEDIDSHVRWEMESIYLLYNLGDSYTLNRAISLPFTNEITFDISLAISLARIRNDYFTICHLLLRLPVLHQIVLSTQLPGIRRDALKAMSSAYSSKNLTYPLSHLTRLLLFNNDKQASAECQYYGLKVEDGKIHFLKASFDCSVKLASMKKMDSIDAILKETDISQMLLENNFEGR